jgi:hypothetical protein
VELQLGIYLFTLLVLKYGGRSIYILSSAVQFAMADFLGANFPTVLIYLEDSRFVLVAAGLGLTMTWREIIEGQT